MGRNCADAYLLDGVRTPFGKYRGALGASSPVDLGACAVREMLRRHPWASTPSAALMGVVVQAGLGQNPARIAAVRGGAEPTTPALTLNNVCLASLEAVCDATRRIRLGEGSHYLVGGFDSMTRAPQLLAPEMDGSTIEPLNAVLSDGLRCAFAGDSMGGLSDRYNRELRISREAQDAWAHRSHLRAAATAGVTQREELVAVQTQSGLVTDDQGVRPDTRMEALATLKPAFTDNGSITAGNASQRADGASAGLVVDGATLARSACTPLARIVDWGWVAGPDPTLHLKPAAAIRQVLEKQRLRPSDIDLYEINEAFAAVAIATCRDLGLLEDAVNVNGGAVAIGHPLGATGFRLLLTLALELRRRGARRGIASLCGGGGQGLAVLIETSV